MMHSKPRLLLSVTALCILTALAFIPCAQGEAAKNPAPVPLINGNPPPGASLFEIFMINLARDDCFFLRLNGQTLLIDGGHEERFPRLRAFLQKENESLTVDAMLNTHQHDDHITGAIALLQRGGGARQFFGPLSEGTKNAYYQILLPLLKETGAAYTQLFHGDILLFGGGRPGDPPMRMENDFAVQPEDCALIRVFRCGDTPKDTNSTSLMLHITYGHRTLFLLADATGRSQSYLLETVDRGDLKADVLKAAHHGLSPTVQLFLDAVDPLLGVITNQYGNTENQSRQFRLRNIPTLYTGEGTVYLATDGETWYFRQDPPA